MSDIRGFSLGVEAILLVLLRGALTAVRVVASWWHLESLALSVVELLLLILLRLHHKVGRGLEWNLHAWLLLLTSLTRSLLVELGWVR